MKKILSIITIAVIASLFIVAPQRVFAEGENCPKTIILFGGGQLPCDENGENIEKLLTLVVEIMTVGIGILGVIGITITGIQYLTAGGSEEKTRKAKRRMFEIIIGLALYATFYLFMKWISPSFEPPKKEAETSQASTRLL